MRAQPASHRGLLHRGGDVDRAQVDSVGGDAIEHQCRVVARRILLWPRTTHRAGAEAIPVITPRSIVHVAKHEGAAPHPDELLGPGQVIRGDGGDPDAKRIPGAAHLLGQRQGSTPFVLVHHRAQAVGGGRA